MRLFREKNFGHLGLTVDLIGAVVNMEDVGYNNKTESIDVISGVYVLGMIFLLKLFWSPTFAIFVDSDDVVFLQVGGL